MNRLATALVLFLVAAHEQRAEAAWKPKKIDAVLAAVDGRPICLSELRARAVPQLVKIRATIPGARERDAAEVEMMKAARYAPELAMHSLEALRQRYSDDGFGDVRTTIEAIPDSTGGVRLRVSIQDGARGRAQ